MCVCVCLILACSKFKQRLVINLWVLYILFSWGQHILFSSENILAFLICDTLSAPAPSCFLRVPVAIPYLRLLCFKQRRSLKGWTCYTNSNEPLHFILKQASLTGRFGFLLAKQLPTITAEVSVTRYTNLYREREEEKDMYYVFTKFFLTLSDMCHMFSSKISFCGVIRELSRSFHAPHSLGISLTHQ